VIWLTVCGAGGLAHITTVSSVLSGYVHASRAVNSFIQIADTRKRVVISAGNNSPDQKCDKGATVMEGVRNVYFNRSTADLRRLKSEKYVRYERIEHDMGYFAMQEKRKLRQQIMWIDAVLASRGLQLGLGL